MQNTCPAAISSSVRAFQQTQLAVFAGEKPVRDHVLVIALATPAAGQGMEGLGSRGDSMNLCIPYVLSVKPTAGR